MIIRNRLQILCCAGLLAAAAAMSGCQKTEREAEREIVQPEESLAEEAAAEETAIEEAPAEEAAAEETPAEETAAEAQTEDPGPESEIDPDLPGSFGLAFLENEVENNGGFFMRVGSRIFFRKYGKDVLPESVLFGNFLNMAGQPETSELCAYDPETNEIEVVFEDHGYGRIYAAANGFWLKQRREDGLWDDAVYVSEDGSQREVYPMEHPVGVNEEGSLVVLEAMEENRGPDLMVRCGGEETARVWPEDSEALSFCGIAGNDVVFLVYNYQEQSSDLYSMDARTAELTHLGAVELPEGTEPGSYPEPERFEPERDGVALTFGWYGGTGHFLNHSAVFTAIPGTADSLRLKETGVLEEKSDPEWTRVLYPDIDYNADPTRIVQSIEWIDGDAYVITALARRVPEDDIGWREAYTCLQMNWDRIDGQSLPMAAQKIDPGVISPLAELVAAEP
ncbi:MAG: hypothetical protein IJV26_05615 [Lachnospiraceae bacterium]|nr:hypothetical protein [Lachnospiraceae bacterium]